MASASVDRETMMRRVRLSGLLTPEQVQRAYDLAARTANGQELGKLLIEDKLLTKFQARMLLAGRTHGFMLGQYRILEPIGKGGMGRVFRAEHVGMGRIVAIKVLASQLVQTEKARQLFDHEVKVAARLHHPNIVTAYDANQVGDKYFLVMEYVDGPNLQDLVDEDGPLPVGIACDLVRQAALGLQYAHERGMVHRDVKPSNLLIQRHNPMGPGCLVKILDFGLARLHYTDAVTGESKNTLKLDGRTVMGTPDYLSPEQARDLHGVDIRSDLYSLGCTFYFLLTGRPPFPGGNALEKLVKHFTEKPTPLAELRDDVPAGVIEVVENLMEKNPLERYQAPLDVALALVPFSVQPPGFLMPDLGEMAGDSSDNINLASTWPGHDTAQLAASGHSSFLIRRPPPPVQRKWDWIQAAMLALALGLGFVLGAAALAVVMLLRSRGQ
jgi:serine/threonine-protein kinase